MKDDFVSSGRSVSDLKAHLVLTTKYRCKVFTAEMLGRLTEIVGDLCEKWDCKLIEVNGEADHIHILFQYYPQMALPKFVNNLKSVSSRRLRAEFAERVNKFYWRSVLWNESYFIASCGGVTVSVLKRYIEQQDSPDSGTSGAKSFGQASPTNPPSAPGSHPEAPLCLRQASPTEKRGASGRLAIAVLNTLGSRVATDWFERIRPLHLKFRWIITIYLPNCS